jgi:hypothetical protein
MAEYAISPAWRLNDQNIERQAIQFWRTLNILPRGVEPEARAKELCAIAHRGVEVAGVSTVSIEELRFLRSRFAMFRCAVAPPHRLSHVAYELTVFSRALLERWSLEHPEEPVKGMGLIIEAEIGKRAQQPLWPVTGLTLVGFTPQGLQIRVAWFPHARLD